MFGVFVYEPLGGSSSRISSFTSTFTATLLLIFERCVGSAARITLWEQRPAQSLGQKARLCPGVYRSFNFPTVGSAALAREPLSSATRLLLKEEV